MNEYNQIGPSELRDDVILKRFKLNTEAKYSITRPFEASQIMDFISFNFQKGLNFSGLKNYVITDATSGAGGDTIKFSNYFKGVNSVELNKDTYILLLENIIEFECNNINQYNSDYTDIMLKLKQDIVYMDPPWGGTNYKDKKEIVLQLGHLKIEDIARKLFEKDPDLIIFIKVPLNVRTVEFEHYITNQAQIINKVGIASFKILKLQNQQQQNYQKDPTANNLDKPNPYNPYSPYKINRPDNNTKETANLVNPELSHTNDKGLKKNYGNRVVNPWMNPEKVQNLK